MPIPLTASKFYYTEANDQTSDRDIAAIHLDKEAVEEFYPQRRFLTSADCDLLLDPKPGLYMVAGFPDALYEMVPIARGTAMFFMGAVDPNPPSVVFDPSVHLWLSLEGAGRRATDTEFVAEAIPEFPGMSGCGIWRIASGALSDPDSWNPSMVRLVAIQNRTGHASHTLGTWIVIGYRSHRTWAIGFGWAASVIFVVEREWTRRNPKPARAYRAIRRIRNYSMTIDDSARSCGSPNSES